MIAIEWQGRVFGARNLAYQPRPPEPQQKRGSIFGFSKRSRSRMIDLMMRLDLSNVKVTFLTLTFSGKPSPNEAKMAFKRWRQRLNYFHPEVSAVWRMEFQKRGAIHFHLLLFNCPFLPQRQLQNEWTECTREERSIVHIKLISSHRQVINYVSKYIGKVDNPAEGASLENEPYQQKMLPEWTGRVWGYINKDALPMAEKLVLYTEDEDLAGYLWFASRALSRGRTGTRKYFTKLFTEEGESMYLFALEHGATTEGAFLYRLNQAYMQGNGSAVPL